MELANVELLKFLQACRQLLEGAGFVAVDREVDSQRSDPQSVGTVLEVEPADDFS